MLKNAIYLLRRITRSKEIHSNKRQNMLINGACLKIINSEQCWIIVKCAFRRNSLRGNWRKWHISLVFIYCWMPSCVKRHEIRCFLCTLINRWTNMETFDILAHGIIMGDKYYKKAPSFMNDSSFVIIYNSDKLKMLCFNGSLECANVNFLLFILLEIIDVVRWHKVINFKCPSSMIS